MNVDECISILIDIGAKLGYHDGEVCNLELNHRSCAIYLPWDGCALFETCTRTGLPCHVGSALSIIDVLTFMLTKQKL